MPGAPFWTPEEMTRKPNYEIKRYQVQAKRKKKGKFCGGENVLEQECSSTNVVAGLLHLFTASQTQECQTE